MNSNETVSSDICSQEEYVPVLLNHADQFIAYATKLTRNSYDAENLVQTAWVRALGHPPKVNNNLVAWMRSIIFHEFVNQYRKMKKSPFTDFPEFENDSAIKTSNGEPELSDLVDQLSDPLVHGLNSIHSEWKNMLLDFSLNNLSYKELAEKYGLKLGTVMSRIYRIRQLMISYLGEDYLQSA